ncbi:hypothetical protein SELMODRAFT_132773, partial [Selaginella moellendorffii]
NLPVGDGTHPIFTLKARAVLVDMEEGVVNQLLMGNLSELFNSTQLITDISGSGNNWAHGHNFYGPKYSGTIIEKVRREAEICSSLQGFFLLHSLGGGTGSGLGSYILELLHDAYPKVFRFSASLFPSTDDDVITSPYNSVLSIGSLTQHADCVFPIENQALIDILRKKGQHKCQSSEEKRNKAPFDAMNALVSSLLLNLTSSMRFEGQLNVDLNEITTNLIPYPRLHYLISSMALFTPKGKLPWHPNQHTKLVNQVFLFSDALSKDNYLIKSNPLESVYFNCAFLLRGTPCSISDVNESIVRSSQRLNMIHWNTGGFKVGVCRQPASGIPLSLVCLANNTCIRNRLLAMKHSFNMLFRKRVYIHHYTEYMDFGMFNVCSGS